MITGRILAVDPGTTHSAYVLLDGLTIQKFGKVRNEELLGSLHSDNRRHDDFLAIEMAASYGKPVGAEVFQTVLWTGRMVEAWNCQRGGPWLYSLVYRQKVKMHHCHAQAKVTDGHIRQAIIDRYGGKEAGIGKKSSPGPLWGISSDVWQALAIGLFAKDTDGLCQNI